MTCLGISIGTTRTGVCVLKGDTLMERNVHNYHVAWNDDKLRVIINRYKQYIVKHNVTAVIVKIPPLHKHTKGVRQLLNRIAKLAAKYNCDYDLITKTELKDITETRSTNELIYHTVLLYPELYAVFDKGENNKHRYYRKLFEAVLSAHIFEERLQRKAEQLK